jgi:hypothetical protein
MLDHLKIVISQKAETDTFICIRPNMPGKSRAVQLRRGNPDGPFSVRDLLHDLPFKYVQISIRFKFLPYREG